MQPENIRLEKFRKLKKEVRGSGKYLLIGIDVAKEKHIAFFGTATGKTLVKGLVFENSRQGFVKLLTEVEAVKVKNKLGPVVFGLEPTANYHKPLGQYLINQDQEVVLVSGTAVRRNRELLDGRWDKHDLKDAANVADLISQSKFQYYEHPRIEIRELRGLLSLKKKLKRQQQGLRIRIRNNLLSQYFPEMEPYYNTCERDNLAIIKNCLSPTVISGMDYADFFKTVVSRKNGLLQHKHLHRIWQLAGESIGCESDDGAACEARVLVEQLKSTREAIEQVDDTMLKMAGFDLSASRSGKTSEKALPVISKKGKADLRYGLYQAALVASTHNKSLKKYFEEKVQGREKEKGIKTKMRVKLAAKMLVIAWTLMKKKEPFNPEYLTTN